MQWGINFHLKSIYCDNIPLLVVGVAFAAQENFSHRPAFFIVMYLLYLDESGNVNDANQRHFVLAGFSVFERQAYYLAKALDELAAKLQPIDSGKLEFHGNEIYGARGRWRGFRGQQEKVYQEVLDVFCQSNLENRIFIAVVEKTAISPDNPSEHTFEQVSSRSDHYLTRLFVHHKQQARGIIVCDDSGYEKNLQRLTTLYRTDGHTWGKLRNLVEVPMFVDSQASRLIQLADVIAYAVYRKFEYNDERFFAMIENRIDTFGGIKHGLYTRLVP